MDKQVFSDPASPEIRTMPLADLKPAPYNPRRIDAGAMAGLTASIERFGNVQPIVFNRRSGHVVGGHRRLEVLRRKQVKVAEVVVVDLDSKEERALNIALNNPHIAGEFTERLDELLAQVRADDEVLFRSLRFDELLGELTSQPGNADPDAAPPAPAVARTKPGMLYQLGRHRLLCGDSTGKDRVSRLLGDERVDSMVTDPPYGVDYASKNAFLNKVDKGNCVQRDIANDITVEGGYRAWFSKWLSIVPWAEYASFHIFMSNVELHNLRNACDDLRFKFGSLLVWVKNVQILGRADYSNKHEIILFGWPKRHRFYAKGHPSTVLEYDKPRKSELHPTMKPVELLMQLISDGSAPGALVYDPFAGSGSTLIAAEMNGRRCCAMEIDPLYCDVIVGRWERFTGKRAANA